MYTINFKDQSKPSITINERDLASGISSQLWGQRYVRYEHAMQETLLHIMENFAHDTSPPNPIQGQQWYDTNTLNLKTYNGSSWNRTNKIVTQGTAVPADDDARLWFNDNNLTDFLYVHDGLNYQSVFDGKYLHKTGGHITGNLRVESTVTVQGDLETDILNVHELDTSIIHYPQTAPNTQNVTIDGNHGSISHSTSNDTLTLSGDRNLTFSSSLLNVMGGNLTASDTIITLNAPNIEFNSGIIGVPQPTSGGNLVPYSLFSQRPMLDEFIDRDRTPNGTIYATGNDRQRITGDTSNGIQVDAGIYSRRFLTDPSSTGAASSTYIIPKSNGTEITHFTVENGTTVGGTQMGWYRDTFGSHRFDVKNKYINDLDTPTNASDVANYNYANGVLTGLSNSKLENLEPIAYASITLYYSNRFNGQSWHQFAQHDAHNCTISYAPGTWYFNIFANGTTFSTSDIIVCSPIQPSRGQTVSNSNTALDISNRTYVVTNNTWKTIAFMNFDITYTDNGDADDGDQYSEQFLEPRLGLSGVDSRRFGFAIYRT